MTDEDRSEKKLVLLTNQVNVLMGSFDTVQIFATKHEDGKTHHYHYGQGNLFARYGQIKLWVKNEESE